MNVWRGCLGMASQLGGGQWNGTQLLPGKMLVWLRGKCEEEEEVEVKVVQVATEESPPDGEGWQL